MPGNRLRNSGVVDITTKSDVFNNGGSVDMYGGSYWTMQPSIEYGGDLTVTIISSPEISSTTITASIRRRRTTTRCTTKTNQEHGFAYLEKIINPNSKVSAILGSFVGRFQIPNNPGQAPANTVSGNAAFDSNALNETQRESANFGVLSFLYSETDWSLQVSGFTKYSTLNYSPDIFGDLAFNGISQYALRQDQTTGLQADASYNLNSQHTLRTAST